MSGSSDAVGADAVLVVDFGTAAVRVAVAAGGVCWLVPEPVTGAASWPAAAHWDGARVRVGARAEQAGPTDPDGYWPELRNCLTIGTAVSQGGRLVRPVELVTALLWTVGDEARRLHGVGLDRTLLTVPASHPPGGRYRAAMVAAAEAAGLSPVELLPEPVAAVCAHPAAPGAGGLVLVCDLGAASVDCALVKTVAGPAEPGGGEPELLGCDTLGGSGHDPARVALACQRLLRRLEVPPASLAAVLVTGGGVSEPATQELARSLGQAPRVPSDPELAVVSGAARWLARRGALTVAPEPLAAGTEPLAFAIPGGRGHLVRWLVRPGQRYGQGEVLARVRVAGGGLWDLVAAAPGTLAQVLVGPDVEVAAHQWLALATP